MRSFIDEYDICALVATALLSSDDFCLSYLPLRYTLSPRESHEEGEREESDDGSFLIIP
jgi:hypothetical protein